MRSFTLSLIALIVVLSGCEGNFPLSTASLGDPAMSTAVDLKTQAPLEKATIFSADVKKLYATIKLKSGPAGTKVSAVFYYLEGNRQKIAEQSVSAEGSGYLDFPINPPESGWPVGRYEVEFSLNDEVKEKTGYSVVPAADMPASKGFPASQGSGRARSAGPGTGSGVNGSSAGAGDRRDPPCLRSGEHSSGTGRTGPGSSPSWDFLQDLPGQAVRVFLRIA